MEVSPLAGVTVEESDVAVVLRVRGEIDMAGAPLVEVAVTRILADAPTALIIDLSAVTFMGSCGVQVLVAAHSAADEQGCRLVLVECSPRVSRVLRLTGVIGLFTLALTTDDAVAVVRQPRCGG